MIFGVFTVYYGLVILVGLVNIWEQGIRFQEILKTSTHSRPKAQNLPCTGGFNATEFLKQWNSLPGNPQRDLDRFWQLESTQEFIKTLMQEENLHMPHEVYVKSRASKGKNAGTWMHSYLFIDLSIGDNQRDEFLAR